MSQKESKTSWADESDELDQQQQTSAKTTTVWAKPWESKNKDENQKDQPESERNEEREPDREGERQRRPRAERPKVEFPTSPPYTAFVGNLPFDLQKEELRGFFEDNGCRVNNVRLLINKETNRPKGFGYVVFMDAQDLRNALDLSGIKLFDRPLRIDVAEGKSEDNRPQRSNYRNNRERQREGREYQSDDTHAQQEAPKERPKLNLLPPSSSSTNSETSDTNKGNKVSPFGGAKPRDENLYLKSIEEKRKQREATTPEENGAKQPEQSPSSEETNEHATDATHSTDKQRKDYPNKKEYRPPRDNKERPKEGGRPGPRNQNRGPRKDFRRDDQDRPRNRSDKDRSYDNKPERQPKPQKESKQEPKLQVQSKNMFAALPDED